MRWRWLGWAGVELEVEGATVVIDPLADPAAVFAQVRDREVKVPQVCAPTPRTAVAGLLTHLHRDHADAAALHDALAPGAAVFEPLQSAGAGRARLGIAQAEAELAATGRERRRTEPWQQATAGPFSIAAVPAVDGTGEPQVSWVVAAGGQRVLHLGDTMPHGGWWPIAERHGPFDLVLAPVNGAVVNFPHRQPASPLPVVMDPAAAAAAVTVLGARLAVPIHADGYAVEGVYAPVANAAAAFATAAQGVTVAMPRLGAWHTLEDGRP